MYSFPSYLSYDGYWEDYCGIPGGIPNLAQYGATLGPSTTTAQLTTAMAACNAAGGGAVVLGEGTFNSIVSINFSNYYNVAVRGQGPKTIITGTTSPTVTATERWYMIGGGTLQTGISILSGYTKGSTSITLASAPNSYFSVNNILAICQQANPNTWGTGIGSYYRTGLPYASSAYGIDQTRVVRWLSRITAISGNTITFATPIPFDFDGDFDPLAYSCTSPSSARMCGLEKMTLQSSTDTSYAVRFRGVDRCWVKDVACTGYSGGELGVVHFANSVQCEIRRNYVHDVTGYPLQMEGYPYFLHYGCCNFKVEDNISYQTNMIALNGSSGNMLTNNYSVDPGYSPFGDCRTWLQQAININHGPHSMMNLVEGNVGPRFQSDGYHGSSSHNIMFRNHMNGLRTTATQRYRIADLSRASYYVGMAGNVIGDTTRHPANYEFAIGQLTVDCAYILGYPMDSVTIPSAQPPLANYVKVITGGITDTGGLYVDEDVKGTMIRQGNYDYHTGGVYEWADTDHDLPDSLAYSYKPAFFGILAWPPIGYDVTGIVNQIPAQWRWQAYLATSDIAALFADTPSPGGIVLAPANASAAVASPEIIIGTTGARSFTLAAVPTTRTIDQPNSTTYNITATPVGGYSGNINLTTTGLPTGATCVFSPSSIGPSGTSVLTVYTTGMSGPTGTYSVIVRGEEA